MKHRTNSVLMSLLGAAFLLCIPAFIDEADAQPASRGATSPVQAFSAVLWTTTTLHSPAGKPSTFMQRTVYTRDASGNVRREVYRPTKGFLHDTTAPLERVLTGSSSAPAPLAVQSSKETVEQQVDLGTMQLSGLLAIGRRKVFRDVNSQQTHTIETWLSPTLGLPVHMESRDALGNTVISDLSEIKLGNTVLPPTEKATVVSPAIPLLNLYRGLFMLTAHMERDRLANDPNRHVNMDEIEENFRKKLDLSASEWQVVVDTSIKVEKYTREMSKQARSFADQDQAARQQNPLSSNTVAAGRATLHKMQLDLNAHLQGEIDQLKTAVGQDATNRIEAYLQGPLAASTSRVQLTAAQLQALRAHKEQAR